MEEDRTRRVKLSGKSTNMVAKPTLKKVQVVYYLSKNGHLGHPHVVEVTHMVQHHLRLKDVLDRLSVLRGRGMPCLYSWSCKRMYKNGYVWNDLGENDIICPSEGDEFVLKASQLVHHCPDKQTQVDVGQTATTNLPKRRPTTPKRHTEFNEEELEYEEKRISYTNTPSRSSRGDAAGAAAKSPELTLLSSPPPSLSTTSGESNTTSKRFEDGDPDPTQNRNSLLLHFMACGGSMGFKGKTGQHLPAPSMVPVTVPARKSSCSSSSLHKGVLCKAAAAAVEDEICCMSENPRFGILQAEEREYFSGSIVEAIAEERLQVEPTLIKSNSYNEERRCKATMAMADAEEEGDEMKREKRVTLKCIPKRFSMKAPKI